MCIAVVTTGAAPYCCAQSSAVEGRTKQNWSVDEASAWGQSTKRLDMMAAEEGGGGGADVAAGDDASGGVAEGGRLIGLPCDAIA